MESLRETPLFLKHKELGAKMGPFGGWNMPIQYSGIVDERNWCRTQSALFDICHMGEFYFKGSIEKSGIDSAFSMSLWKIKPGRCKYGFLLNNKGGVIDDLIVYRLSEDELMIVVNAATSDNDFQVIKKSITGSYAEFTDISSETAKLDLQGPLSGDVLFECIDPDAAGLGYFRFKKHHFAGSEIIVSRTGYTGELGYELYIPRDSAPQVWDTLLADERVAPAGLGARDILRLEMGLSLYGHELTEDITPVEACLEMFVDYSGDFTGKEALEAQKEAGLKRQKVAFKTTSRRSPREGYEIFVDNRKVGVVTSGTFSPASNTGIGLGYITPEFTAEGTKVVLSKGKIKIDAVIADLPFYKDGSARKK